MSDSALKNFRLILITLLIAFFCVGKLTLFNPQKDQLFSRVGQKVSLAGTVDSFPDVREKNTRVFVQTELGRLLLIDDKKHDFLYGDLIEVHGKLTRSYPYFHRFKIYTRMYHPEEIIFLEPGKSWLTQAQKIREIFSKNLEQALPSPHHVIATGILLGVKNELSKDVKQNFQRSGLQHLLVVSGFNVSIVMYLTMISLRKLGRRIALIGSLLVLIFFVGMTGAEPPVIRAALMGGLVGLGKIWGRRADILNILLFSAVIMGLFDPRIISSDIGFHLSFTATLGIIVFAERIKLPAILSVSLAAQLSVAPLLIFYFGSFPLAGLVANIFAEPLIPITMAASSLPAFTGSFGLPAEILLEILLLIAHFFGS